MQYRFDTGSTFNVIDMPLFSTFDTQAYPNEEIRILVDTSEARTVVIPRTTMFPIRNIRITVVDITGNASTNNITVQVTAGATNDYINGASTSVLDEDFQSARYEVVEEHQWNVLGGSAGTTGGGGGGGAVELRTFDQTFTAVEILALLNSPAVASEVLVSPVAANQVIELLSSKMLIEYNSTPYDNEDAFLFIASASSLATPYDAIVRSVPLILQADLSAYTAAPFAWDFLPFIATRPEGDNLNAVTRQAGGLYLMGQSEIPVNAGNSPVRVFGTYTIKSLT